jgi:phosphoribosyl 1,2-cyclic phosphodiesterase
MQTRTLASGSSGNCYLINDGFSSLLIECGIRFGEIRQGCDFKMSQISACLITHEHQDHCKAVRDVMKAGIDCYATAGTWEAINLPAKHHRQHIITPAKQLTVGSWTILPFPIEHDAREPVGFLCASKAGYKLLYLSDSYYCRYRFQGLTHIMVECNYHYPILLENLEAGIVSPAQKKRILRSHFSLDNVRGFLQACDLSRVEEIHLIHISRDNGDPDLFVGEIEALTGRPTYAH